MDRGLGTLKKQGAAKKQSEGLNQRQCFSSALTALWLLFQIYTPGAKMRSAGALAGHFVRTCCRVPPWGQGMQPLGAPQSLGFHCLAALERQLLHLVGKAPSGLGPWACSFIPQSRRRCPSQPQHAAGLPALCHRTTIASSRHQVPWPDAARMDEGNELVDKGHV